MYSNIDTSLSRLPVAALYIVANIALGIHLFHGTWSLFQTMGWSSKRFNPWRRYLAIGLAVVVTSINLTYPLGTMFGVIDCGEECEAIAEEFSAE